jgi:hypothetical protein
MSIKIKQLVVNLTATPAKAPVQEPALGFLERMMSERFVHGLRAESEKRNRTFGCGPTMKPNTIIPAIGAKWPGTEAKYSGISLSKCGTKLVHLIVWPDTFKERVNHEQAIKKAEEIAPDWNSHLPTRYQGITLFTNLRDEFDKDCYHWLLEKTKDGKGAFVQNFAYGYQYWDYLDGDDRVRAVSEIPL